MADKGTLSKVNRIQRELEKLHSLVEDGQLKGINAQSLEALRDSLERARMCTNNVLAELGDERVYG